MGANNRWGVASADFCQWGLKPRRPHKVSAYACVHLTRISSRFAQTVTYSTEEVIAYDQDAVQQSVQMAETVDFMIALHYASRRLILAP